MHHRTIMIRTLDDRAATEVIAKLLFLRQESTDPICLYINSPGGQVSSTLAIRDMIDEMRSQVSTHCVGQAVGTALLLLAHGALGHRSAAATARLSMLEIESRSRPSDLAEIQRVQALVVQLLAEDTGQSADVIARDLAAMRSFDAQEACAYGLIDHVDA